jgi:hypothetical protein
MRYQSKPEIVEAIQVGYDNLEEVELFLVSACWRWTGTRGIGLVVTDHGRETFLPGSWIIKKRNGEYGVLQDKKFQDTYDMIQPVMIAMKPTVEEVQLIERLRVELDSIPATTPDKMSGMEEPEGFDFSQALILLREGSRLARVNWNGAGMWVALQIPDDHSKMRLPYLYLKTDGGDFVPWVASQTDILAEDWRIAS